MQLVLTGGGMQAVAKGRNTQVQGLAVSCCTSPVDAAHTGTRLSNLTHEIVLDLKMWLVSRGKGG